MAEDRRRRAPSVARSKGFVWAARATLLVWLLDPPLGWPFAVPGLVLAGAGVLDPRLARSRWLWLGLSCLACFRIGADWMLADNHHYLMAIWCIALVVSTWDDEPGRAVAVNARRLIGLTFAFAVVWKAVLSPDFRDGHFFRVTWLADSRFESAAVAFGGLGAEDIVYNDRLLSSFDPAAPFDPSATAVPALRETPRLRRAAPWASAWTIAIELAVALAFLWPGRFRIDPGGARDVLLLVFAATTYALAPVAGFGWLLMAMGLAQCGSRVGRWAYGVGFAVILVQSRVPWLDRLAERALD